MEEKEIEQRVKRIICGTLCLQQESVDNSDSLIYLDAGSHDIANIIKEINEEFGIEIMGFTVDELNTVGDYVDCVKKKVC